MEYIFFSSAHGRSSRTDRILGHTGSGNKIKNKEIVPSIFSDQNNMKLEISHMKRNEKKSDYMETEEHVTKKPISQQWNQRGNKKN